MNRRGLKLEIEWSCTPFAFYFPILDTDRVIIDDEGVELADLHAAISEADRRDRQDG